MLLCLLYFAWYFDFGCLPALWLVGGFVAFFVLDDSGLNLSVLYL
jgi:hypothetical protein